MQEILLVSIFFFSLRFRCQNHGALHYSFSIHFKRIKFCEHFGNTKHDSKERRI